MELLSSVAPDDLKDLAFDLRLPEETHVDSVFLDLLSSVDKHSDDLKSNYLISSIKNLFESWFSQHFWMKHFAIWCFTSVKFIY